MAGLPPVEGAFLDDADFIVIGGGIGYAGPHTARCSPSTYQEGIYMASIEQTHQGSAEKDAGFGFVDYEVAFLGGYFANDVISVLCD